MSNLRFFSFRNEWDLDQLKEKGYITVTEDMSENPIFYMAKDYFKSEGILWCFIVDDVGFDYTSYLGNTTRVEFKPDKYLKFSLSRYNMLQLIADSCKPNVYGIYDKNMSEEQLLTNFMRTELCCNDKFLELCKTEETPNKVYIGIVPYIRKEDILEIKYYKEANTKPYGEFKYNND